MAGKKKGHKKAQDDWDEGLGETIEPVADEAQPAAQNEEEEMGGGLLATLKKNRSKKQKKGKNLQNDFVEGEAPVQADDTQDEKEEPVSFESKAPQEASFDDDVFAVSTKKGKHGGKHSQKEEHHDVPVEEEGEDHHVLTKKEKEKLKKEREKQRKKEQAAKKKGVQTATTSKPETPKPEESTPVATLVPETSAKGGKKKKVSAALAAIQKQQEALRKAQEEQARIEAEERARAEEEERLAAEEEKKRQEEKERKKQKEKERIEQLKKEGKYLTPAQQAARAKAERRNRQMLAAGGMIAAFDDSETKKKPVNENKKKRSYKKQHQNEEVDLEKARIAAEEEALKRAAEEEKRQQEEEEARLKAESIAAAEKQYDDVVDDWEAAADGEDVPESWDAVSDDEEKSKTKQPSSKSTAAASKPSVKQAAKHSESESESESDDDVTVSQKLAAQKKAEAAERRKKQHEEALAARSKDNLRSPICCILGHVDTGKTKLLDKIRQTNVQEGEAGGITQQIGATYFPTDALRQKTAVVNKDGAFEFKVPGLLVIDTPGHESFSNLRSRGSSLCNIAILVVDIMHGLEPQTLESMKLLRDRKTPFIVALNKIDRLYGWKKIDNNGFQESLAVQNKGVLNEFRDRVDKVKLEFSVQGFNSELFYENKSMARNVSLVPTSAHTGEGIPDMLKLLVTLTQERMTTKLMYLSEVECTVLEVKVIEGLGTTIDVVLSNGVLHEGDRIVLCGINGPIATTIRALLTPAPLKELRLKSQYVHNKEVKASLGVKIAANDLEHAIAGSRLLVVGPEDDEEDLEDEVMSDLENLLNKVSKDQRGVSVQASTLGSLEALLEFLKQMKIPVANIGIGPVYKRDVMMAGTMLEKAKEYAVMLCFDVKIDKEAQAYADEVGIKVFTADIIYHLFDDFTKHMSQLAEQRKEESKLWAVFPCILQPVAVFNKKDPIVVGVDVVEGSLKLLTPIAAVKTNPVTGEKEVLQLGRVQSIEREHKQINVCKKGQPAVAIKIEGPNQPLYGRHLEEGDTLYSLISRQSIDTLKQFYRSDVADSDWKLIRDVLKPLFNVA